MHFHFQQTSRRTLGVHLALLIALILNFVPAFMPGGEVPTASAHNLNSSVVYAFFDPTTQALLDNRIAGGWTPGTPILQPNDELGIIIKTVPDSGTTTGVGGYTTFYIPNGVQVVDAGFVMPGDFISDGISGWDKVPAKGQAQMPIVGAGGESTVNLVGITRGPNVLGVTSPIVRPDNTNLGTLPGVYGDTGIFYSTAPETAFGTYTGGSITNNSGDTVGARTILGTTLNLWDAWQMAGYGIKGTTNPNYPSAALIDSNQRGYAPWGLANVVAGPQSGYAWEFDFAKYAACDPTPTTSPDANCIDLATQDIGPWQRIQYEGSQFADDPPGGTATLPQPYTRGADASNAGFDLSPANPLPLTTGQSNGTPNAIRWAFGQLTYLSPEYAWVKIKINNPSGIVDPTGCPRMYIDTFGGDAGGDSGGKDHIWRYYDPNSVIFNGCLAIGKPATRELVKVGDVYQYKIKVYNLANFAYSNVTVKDTLPSGVTFVSAIPAQDSGPNPLQWNNIGAIVGDKDGQFEPGEMFEATVTVKASSSGVLRNELSVTGTPPSGPPQEVTTSEGTVSSSLPLLRTLKSVTPTAAAPGGQVEYTVEVKNVGNGPTGSPVVITEFLPSGFTYVGPLVSATLNGANVTANTTVNAANPAQPVFSVPGAISANNEMVIKFKAQIASTTVAGSYCNSYRLTQNGINQLTGSLACVDVGAGTIGDTVFRDWDGNGIQDAGDEGLAGITVNLYAGACPASGSPVQSKATDANGNYLFTGLLSPASYCVDPVSPAGYTLTTPTDPRTVSLAQNETNLNVDFGYRPGGAGSIGDQLFEDVNNNGNQDPSEPAITQPVTVWLYEDTNGNDQIDSDDLQIATTTTNPANGTYAFTGLATDVNYLVLVDEGDADLSTYFAPNSFVNTTGTLQPVSPADFAANSNTYVDADFGYFAQLPSSIGDEVCYDSNNDGSCAGETLLPGVTVWLYLDSDGDGAPDGSPLKTTSTGFDGTYLFDNLGPGDYLVVVDTEDPNLPAGYVTNTPQLDVTLTAGVDRTDIDFPFVQLLQKSASPAHVNPGGSITFSIDPNYQGSALLSNVRIIDPYPIGLVAPPTSISAGGAYGAYTPVASAPGQDDVNGDGSLILDTAISVNTNLVTKGGSATVTLNVKQNSGSTANVSPTNFSYTGGDATCTGPTPASATVPTGGAGVNFAWTCTLNTVGEYIFSADAANATATVGWPTASSASVLVVPAGGVVTWNLGSNQPGVPSEISIAATSGIYAFRGGNKKEFSKYSTTTGTWSVKRTTFDPARSEGVEKGGALTYDPSTKIIYASEGNAKRFYSYNIDTNAWTRLADASDNFNEGGGIAFLDVSGTKYIFAALGNSNRFRRYSISGNSWTSMANIPVTVKQGGAVTTDGTNIFVLQGDDKTGFYRYNVATNTWTQLANTPKKVKWGGALTYVAPYIYATRGDNTKEFWRYDIAANTWTALASAPGNINEGGALTNDGTYIYALQGKTLAFWRYTIATNTWTTLPNTNFTGNVGQGGALVYIPGAAADRVNQLSAVNTLLSAGDTVHVTMKLSSNAAVNTVTPSALTVTPVNGAGVAPANCGSPTPASINIVANVEVEFTWSCTVSAGTNPGSLKFSANASGTAAVGGGAVSWGTADSNTVLVVPPLSFQATVSNSPAPSIVYNTAILAETSGNIGAVPSNRTQTPVNGSIGDRVWIDLDGDGVQDAGEPGLQGVTVNVTGPNCAPCTATTDASGNYLVGGLVAGNYTVTYNAATVPAGYTPSTPTSVAVVLSAGQQFQDADFGLQPPGSGSIGDRIWLDADNDSVQDGSESGLPGITVTLEKLVNGNWVTLATKITDADGIYTFNNLNTGDYRVTVDASSTVTSPYDSAITSTIDAAMNPTYDRDGTATPHVTLVNLPTDSTNVNSADFGYNWGGSIGDYVWYDTNRNGQQDESPTTPIANAEVRLYFDKNNNGVIDPMEYFDRAATLYTDANGAYLFQNLPPGNYLVDVYEDSVTTDGNRDLVPTTPDVQDVTLGPKQSYLAADFGYYVGALVRGYVFWDEDRNGIFDGSENGLAPVTVYLTPEATVDLGNGPGQPISTLTDGDGYFSFPVPVGTYTLTYSSPSVLAIDPTLSDATTPTSYTFEAEPGEDWSVIFYFGVDNAGKIGDTVWNDANGNRTQDSGEPGLSGVTVTLYQDNNDNNVYDSGDTFIAAQTTDANGKYLFAGVPDGNYVVVVNSGTVPTNFVQTHDNSGGLDHMGQADVSGGNAVLDADFGYRSPATLYTISGRVYNDVNNNNDDNGEPGFPNVDLTIVCTNLGTVTVRTDASGNWSLAGVPAGSSCTVDADETDLPRSDFSATETPTQPITVNGNIANLDFGYHQQPGSLSGSVCNSATGLLGVGPCDDGNDTPIVGATVTLIYAGDDGILGTGDDTVAVDTTDINGDYNFTNLEPGLYVVVQTDLPGYTSLGDRDGGNPNVISPVNLTLGQDLTDQNFEDYIAIPATIKGTVWDDLNGDGVWQSGEPPIPGVTIDLSNGMSTNTDASGRYTFTVTVGGVYTITETNPTGYMSTGDADGGNPDEITITINNGDTILGQDFLDRVIQPNYTLTKTRNTPSPVRLNEMISFTIRITNTGNVTITTLPMTDTYSAFFMTYAGSTIYSNDNVDDGQINWSDLTAAAPLGFGQDLAPGASFVVIVNFIAKADTTSLVNGVTVNNVDVTGATYDPDGPGSMPPGLLPTKSANASVAILSSTAVLLADYGVAANAAVVDLHWQTVDESNIAYFEIYRVAEESSTLVATISAERSGQPSGQGYTYVDNEIAANVWYSYRLEVVQLGGAVTMVELGRVYTGSERIFLPNLAR